MFGYIKIISFSLILCFLLPAYAEGREVLSLGGKWQLFLDTENIYATDVNKIRFNDTIQLPASLDERQKGNKATETYLTSHMQRRYSFYGKAWYRKELVIPQNWKNCEIEFFIERTRPTHVWIDGRLVGSNRLITSPQVYAVTQFLTPGQHSICVLVDNGPDCGLPREISSSHMWSDDTQTNWNGLLGKIQLQTKPALSIDKIKTKPDVVQKAVHLDVLISNTSESDQGVELLISALLADKNSQKQLKDLRQNFLLKKGENQLQLTYLLGKNAKLWSEYSPALYQLQIDIFQNGKKIDAQQSVFGLREFKTTGKSFVINGNKTFLRGRHDACVFPLTGYAPMELNEWLKYYKTIKEYGFNHVRFHSWCPPEAAFEAADLMGIYLHPELPYWGLIENQPSHPVTQFLAAEGKALLDAYANHPSFVMFSTGNELWGDVSGLQYLTHLFRAYDDRPLYALGSNYHLGWKGEQAGEDYMVTCRVGGENDALFEPHVRSSFSFTDAIDGGILNATYPNTSMDFAKGANRTTKPVISHETGQFQMFPSVDELKAYTGVLRPRNLELFIERVENKLGKENYKKYFDATAALSLLCYKADLEMMRRTSALAGFQMLDLQDFPGQGTAVVGILNALMQSKGIISAEEFRSWNDDVVPLWIADSYTYFAGSELKSSIKISNNSATNIKNATLNWSLNSEKGAVLSSGSFRLNVPAGTLGEAEVLNIVLPSVDKALACKLNISIAGTRYRNSYPLWIYPDTKTLAVLNNDVKLFSQYSEELENYLLAGGKAILMPDKNAYPQQTIGGLFTSDYWNYSMFKSISENAKKPVSPGTMGLLIDAKHPLFDEFPTETHSNWQWWAAVKNSNPLILDALSAKIHPIVETIDNVERVHQLGCMFECKVGQGSLFVCMSDLKNQLHYKENKQLYNALIHYVNSAHFQPVENLKPEELKKLFYDHSIENNIKGIRNISYD